MYSLSQQQLQVQFLRITKSLFCYEMTNFCFQWWWLTLHKTSSVVCYVNIIRKSQELNPHLQQSSRGWGWSTKAQSVPSSLIFSLDWSQTEGDADFLQRMSSSDSYKQLYSLPGIKKLGPTHLGYLTLPRTRSVSETSCCTSRSH